MTSPRELIDQHSRTIIEQLGDNLESLILVGSFARGEEIVAEDNGSNKLFSDVEFWAVVKDMAEARKVKPSSANVTLGFTTRSHLSRLKPYIYTIEAKRFGKIIWGDKDILNTIPSYEYEDIAPSDGAVLLHNRIVEQLLLYGKLENSQPLVSYHFDKGYVQLVNAYLALHKRYRGLLPEKLEAFCSLYADTQSGLLENVNHAFQSLKENPGQPIPHNEAKDRWLTLRVHFKAIWQEKCSEWPTAKEKTRDWLKAIGNHPWMPLPRYLIYQKARALYFSDDYTESIKRETIINDWERFVK